MATNSKQGDATSLRTPVWANLLVGIVVLLAILACGESSTGGTTGGGVGGSSVTPTASGPKATATPSFAHFGDGMFRVGKDIQAGTYRTRSGSPGCYYARLKGFGGTTDDIIANNNTDAPAVVTIDPTDAGFESQSCGIWTKDLSQITKSKTTFGDGIFIVATDIAPGTYKNTGVQGCYYARLSGFGGSVDEIIANNNTDAAAIVTIDAADKGFESNRCGTWTQQ